MKKTKLQWIAFGWHFIFYFDRANTYTPAVTRKPLFAWQTSSSNSGVDIFRRPYRHHIAIDFSLLRLPHVYQPKERSQRRKTSSCCQRKFPLMPSPSHPSSRCTPQLPQRPSIHSPLHVLLQRSSISHHFRHDYLRASSSCIDNPWLCRSAAR